jgi:lysophospholipase
VAQVGAWLGARRGRWATAGLFVVVALGWLGLMWLGFGGHDDTGPFVESQPPPGLAERFYPPEGWAWGLIQVGETPAQRYGVVGSSGTPRAEVLILPDYGESAETWFETVRDLNATGATVWVLDGVGQGGSARLTRHRDLGEVTRFDDDVAAVRAMIEIVIQPQADIPLVLLGEGQGALIAARAAERGARPAGLILSSPSCQGTPPDGLRALGLGAQRAPGGSGWRRDGPDAFQAHLTHDRWRGAAGHLWQLANPDLRMGGPSRDWFAAAAQLQTETRADIAQIHTPTLVIAPARTSPCLALSGAATLSLTGAGPALELEDDARRNVWLESIEAFIAAHTRALIPPPLAITRRNAPFQHRHRSVASRS